MSQIEIDLNNHQALTLGGIIYKFLHLYLNYRENTLMDSMGTAAGVLLAIFGPLTETRKFDFRAQFKSHIFSNKWLGRSQA